VGSSSSAEDRLFSELTQLVANPEARAKLGEYSRKFVARYFGLEDCASELASCIEQAVVMDRRKWAVAKDALRTAAVTVLQGKAVPFWSLRRLYRDVGGPPVLPLVRKLLRTERGESDQATAGTKGDLV
jgi:hypothetical protein